jgi:hypothetical protein
MLRLLQAIVFAGLAALVAAFGLVGTHQARQVAGVDCERVQTRAGHVSQWEIDACR